MTDNSKKTIIVTGASSGIGMEAARMFARQGANLVLAARRKDRLESLAEELGKIGCETLVVAIDLSDPTVAGDLLTAARERFGRFDVLVNNAGFSVQTLYETMTQADVQRMFAVNVLTPLELCRQAIPLLQAQGGGVIVNVASVAGFVTSPMNSVYSSTKHALVGFSKSLRQELHGTGVKVTVVCPGNTKTEFFDVASKDSYAYPSLLLKLAAPVEKISAAVVAAADGERAVVIPTVQAKAMYYLNKFLPFLFDLGGNRYRKMISEGSTKPAG